METEERRVISPSRVHPSTEETMLRADVVQELLARVERGEGVKRIARELGIDRRTVKRWRQRGAWRPQTRRRRRQIDPFVDFVARRGPEVGWNCMVLHRELRALGFQAGYLQVQRYVQPLRAARQWAAVATVRFETAPGQQAQVDCGQLRVWIGEALEGIHLFVFTLRYSRRLWVRAYPNERLPSLLAGHEEAFRHFGGVPLECLYDNPHTLVLGRPAGRVLWHPVFADFARYYGFTPRACQPYRAQTKGKTESGVKVRQAERPGRAPVRLLGRPQWLARGVDRHGGRSAGARHDPRAPDRSLHARDPHPPRAPGPVPVRARPGPAGPGGCPGGHRGGPLLGPGALRRRARHGPRDRDSLRDVPRQRLARSARKSRAPLGGDGFRALRRPPPPRAASPLSRTSPMGPGLRLGEVAVRDLAIYEALVQQGGGA